LLGRRTVKAAVAAPRRIGACVPSVTHELLTPPQEAEPRLRVPGGRGQRVPVTPALDDGVVEPGLVEVGMVEDDDLQTPIELLGDVAGKGELRRLRATRIDLLERLDACDSVAATPGALQLAEQAIGLHGLHEPSWRLALQAEHALRLRESITRRYAELTRSLDEQLRLEPARETRLIYRQLLGQT
jgi:hypothetical protein